MKKTKINPYLKYLLKENIGYVGVFIGLIVATILLLGLTVGKLAENKSTIEKLEKETGELQDKQNLIIATTTSNANTLDEDVRIVQQLIPDFEDYFSVLYTLDQLSKKTGFIINSYTVNVGKADSDKLQVVVSGIGSPDSFLNFLKEYNVGGGRLITTEKIELNADDSNSFKLNLTFYNKKVTSKNEKALDYQKALRDFQKIKNKVSFNFQPEATQSATDSSYPIESNPF